VANADYGSLPRCIEVTPPFGVLNPAAFAANRQQILFSKIARK
jgi:hypothetical protein